MIIRSKEHFNKKVLHAFSLSLMLFKRKYRLIYLFQKSEKFFFKEILLWPPATHRTL